MSGVGGNGFSKAPFFMETRLLFILIEYDFLKENYWDQTHRPNT